MQQLSTSNSYVERDTKPVQLRVIFRGLFNAVDVPRLNVSSKEISKTFYPVIL